MTENQSNSDVTESVDATADDKEHPHTMSLMGGVIGTEDATAEDQQPLKPDNKVLNNSTLIVALIAAIAAGSLYLMHLSLRQSFQEDNSTRQAEAKVETWLGKLSNPKKIDKNDPIRPQNIKNLFADTRSIVKVFAGDFTGEQVPIKYVKKNPFKLDLPSDNQSDAANASLIKLRRLKSQLKQLNLQSVMGGDQPVAVINGKLKSQGDKVGPFTIKGIGNLSVTLRASGHTFTLRMNDGQTDNNS